MNNFPKTVIFDVDGTLANCEHRIHWVRSKPKNWMAFNRAMQADTPHWDIVWLLRTFHSAGVTILIASGRSEDDRAVTENWLNNVANISGLYSRLYMRASKDYRRDDIVKSEILDQMRVDGYEPIIAVDDRQQVVDMFRARGLRVLQVAPGDF
jgi:phosphoglycolate phosphatase-like HAD superfamily hydrolase